MEILLMKQKQAARHQNTVQNGQEAQAHPHQAVQAQAHPHHHQVVQVHQVQAHHQAAVAAVLNQWKMDVQDQMKSCQNNVFVKSNVTTRSVSQRGRFQHAQISTSQQRLITSSSMFIV